jgi:hypothetical protein
MYVDGHSANVEYQDGNRIGPALVSGGIYEFTYSSVDVAWKLPAPSDGRTAAEIAAGVTPTNYAIPSHDSIGVIRPQRYGFSTAASATTNTAAIHAAVDVAAQINGAVCRLGPGTFAINETTIDTSYFILEGEGKNSTILSCSGVATSGIALLFSAGASSVWRSGIRGVGFYKADSNTKTAVKFIDGRQCIYSHIGINQGSWAGDSSIGLHTQGRDFFEMENCDIECGRPMVIDNNPNFGTLNTDLWRIFRVQFYTPVSTGSCVEILTGVEITNLEFDNCDFAGGKYGVYYNDTTSTIASYHFGISNSRFEQGADATGYDVYLASTAQNIQAIHLCNVGFTAERRALYLRLPTQVTLKNCQSASTQSAMLDITFQSTTSLILENTLFQTGATHTLTNAVLLNSGTFATGLTSLPKNAQYVYDEAAVTLNQRPDYGYNNRKHWSYTGTLADNATLSTPVTRALYTAAIVKVAAYAATGTIHCGGSAVWTTNGVMTKIGGSSNFVVAAVGVELRCLDGGSGLTIGNVLGQSVTIMVDIEFV